MYVTGICPKCFNQFFYGTCASCGYSQWNNTIKLPKTDKWDNTSTITESLLTVDPGYEPLAKVLQEALDQAQHGKGKQCHANGKPFMEQPIILGGRECGEGGLAFQARKKILEALNCKDNVRAIEDLLGAINYTAAMIIIRRERSKEIPFG